MFNPWTFTSVLFSSLVLFSSILIPPEEAASVVKPMPFEDEYITEIAAIDYPEERIEAYTDGVMVEYIRDKRAEPAPSPTFWPVEEIITTTRYPVLDDDGIIEIIRDKRAAADPPVKFWPAREATYITTRRPFRKGFPQSYRHRRSGPSPSNKPYLKEFITSPPHGPKPYIEEEYITTISVPLYNRIYDSGFVIRPKRAAGGGFFQQCLAKLLGVGVGMALVAALIYYFWYRRLKKAKQRSEEEGEYEEQQQGPHSKRRSPRRMHPDDEMENDYRYQASAG